MKLMILLLLISSVHKEPFKTTGYFQVQFVVDTVDSGQRGPVTSYRINFSPQFYIYGMPVSFRFSIGNEEERLREWLNQFSMKFSPERLLPSLPGLPGFLLSFPGITIGDAYPEFSSFTITGIRVRGLSLKYSPGVFFFAYTGGMIDNAYVKDSLNLRYKRLIRGYKIGIGKSSGTHFHLIYLHSWDDINSINPPMAYYEPDTNVVESSKVVSPEENFVIASDFGFSLKNGISVRGEVAATEVTEDVTADPVESERIPDWAKKKFRPRVSSHMDFAARGSAKFRRGRSELKLKATMIGPGYSSFGLFSTRSDYLRYEVQMRTRVWQNKLGIFISHHNEHDNLADTKDYTTFIKSSHIDLNFYSPGVPFIRIYLERYEQNRASLLTSIIAGGNIGYTVPLGGTSISNQLSFSYQESNQPDTLYNSSKFYTVGLTEVVSLAGPVTVSTNLNYSSYTVSTGNESELNVENIFGNSPHLASHHAKRGGRLGGGRKDFPDLAGKGQLDSPTSQWNMGLNVYLTTLKFRPGAGISYTRGFGFSQLTGNVSFNLQLPFKFNVDFRAMAVKNIKSKGLKHFHLTLTLSKRW